VDNTIPGPAPPQGKKRPEMQATPRRDREDSGPPFTSEAGIEPGRPRPGWAMFVGIALGIGASLVSAVMLFPRGGGDVIAAGSAMAILTIPGGAAFLATSCFARAALQPRRRNGLWLVLVVGLLPLVILVSFFVEAIVGEWIPDNLQAAGPGFHVVREGLPVFLGATFGASVGLGLAGVGRDGRDSVSNAS
jgi:hypothetical protein